MGTKANKEREGLNTELKLRGFFRDYSTGECYPIEIENGDDTKC